MDAVTRAESIAKKIKELENLMDKLQTEEIDLEQFIFYTEMKLHVIKRLYEPTKRQKINFKKES